MSRLFNETFFKFVLGFVALVMASLVLVVVASSMLDNPADRAENCPGGEVC